MHNLHRRQRRPNTCREAACHADCGPEFQFHEGDSASPSVFGCVRGSGREISQLASSRGVVEEAERPAHREDAIQEPYIQDLEQEAKGTLTEELKEVIREWGLGIVERERHM